MNQNIKDKIDIIEKNISEFIPSNDLTGEEHFDQLLLLQQNYKSNGLNFANALLNSSDNTLQELRNSAGDNNLDYQKISDKFIDSVITLIGMQINGNLGLRFATGLN